MRLPFRHLTNLLQLTRRCNTILTNDLVDLRANLLSIIETEVK